MSQSQAPAHSKESIAEWLVQWIAKELGLPAEEIETEKSLLELQPELGDRDDAGRRPGGAVGLTLPPTLVWDYPSIAAIADYLMSNSVVRGRPRTTAMGRSAGDLAVPAGAMPATCRRRHVRPGSDCAAQSVDRRRARGGLAVT